MWALSQSYGLQGRFAQALEYAREALRVAIEIDHLQWMAGSHDSLGRLYLSLLVVDEAREHFQEAARLAHEIGSQYWIRVSRAGLATSVLLSDDLEEAKATLDAAIQPDTPARTAGQRSCWLVRAKIALAADRPERALQIAGNLIKSEPNLRPGQVVTNLWLLCGDALAALGQAEEAQRLYLAGSENGRARGERSLLWSFQISLGRLYQTIGRTQEAEKAFADALSLVETLADTVPDRALRESFLRRAKALIIPDDGDGIA